MLLVTTVTVHDIDRAGRMGDFQGNNLRERNLNFSIVISHVIDEVADAISHQKIGMIHGVHPAVRCSDVERLEGLRVKLLRDDF